MHNQKTNVLPCNFQNGDYVLVRRATGGGHKLRYLWVGPFRIKGAKSTHVFEIEDLVRGKRELAHFRRMLLYRADMDGKEVDPTLLKYAEHSVT